MGSFVLRSIGWFQTRRVGSEMEMSAWVSKLEAAPLKFVKNRKKFTNFYFSGNSLGPGCRDKAALSRPCHCDGAGVLSPQGLLHKYVMGSKKNLAGFLAEQPWHGQAALTKVFHNQLCLDLEQSKMIFHGDKKIVENGNEAPIYERENLESQTILKKPDWRLKDLLIQQVKYYKAYNL